MNEFKVAVLYIAYTAIAMCLGNGLFAMIYEWLHS